jgi:hypothetical protein
MAWLPAAALAALPLALTGCASVQSGAGALGDAVERGVVGGALEGFTGEQVDPNESLDELEHRWHDVVAELNPQQQATLQSEAPSTLHVMKHNDEVVKRRAHTAKTGNSSAHEQTPALAKFSTSDIKALTSAGVKPEVINEEIKKSKTSYSNADISAAQSANVDPSVIDQMKHNAL